ncbi:MAG: cyclic nucleotide-binding domain-containing protein [Stellaceae bacterium]
MIDLTSGELKPIGQYPTGTQPKLEISESEEHFFRGGEGRRKKSTFIALNGRLYRNWDSNLSNLGYAGNFRRVPPAWNALRIVMACTCFAEGQVLFREGDPADSVFRLISGTVAVIRELDGDPILLGTVGAGQFIGEMGVVENRPRSATARAASEVEVEILTPAEFFDQIASSPGAARELIRRLSQRLREADDRIANDERGSGESHGKWKYTDTLPAKLSVSGGYIAAKNPWLQRQFHTPLGLGDLPFLVGRALVAGEELPPLQPDLELDDTAPFRLSRNHFIVEERDGIFHVRDLRSTLGTIVNGEPIGHHFRCDDALLRAGENEIIAGGVDSPFVFSIYIT